ncbi:MAG: response regulator transcription factor [Nocardioidaceae bacterium]|nr:response regulator transcription factor [Nocardioidaceae bacterium]
MDEFEVPPWAYDSRPPIDEPVGLRALVVEDEVELASVLGGYLERGGFEVSLVHDGLDAVDLAREVDPDIVILDLGLPRLDGVEVCRRLRTFSDCYVIMLTARSDEVDTLIGLSVGADDYMTKPFSPRELMARLQAMLRRPRPRAAEQPGTGGADVLVVGDLRVDVGAREVEVAGSPVHLTRTEFDVLATLAQRPRLVFSRRQLIESVWGGSWVGDEHLVDVHVGHLRRKLGDDAGRGRYVRTVRGVGYRMGPAE